MSRQFYAHEWWECFMLSGELWESSWFSCEEQKLNGKPKEQWAKKTEGCHGMARWWPGRLEPWRVLLSEKRSHLETRRGTLVWLLLQKIYSGSRETEDTCRVCIKNNCKTEGGQLCEPVNYTLDGRHSGAEDEGKIGIRTSWVDDDIVFLVKSEENRFGWRAKVTGLLKLSLLLGHGNGAANHTSTIGNGSREGKRYVPQLRKAGAVALHLSGKDWYIDWCIDAVYIMKLSPGNYEKRRDKAEDQAVAHSISPRLEETVWKLLPSSRTMT